MPETPGRFGQITPAINSYQVLFTVDPPPATDRYIYGIDVCNGGPPPGPAAQDAHIKIFVVPTGDGWSSSSVEPPVYTRVIYNQRIEADTTDGNAWVAPVKHLNPGDRVVVWSDTLNVTFYGHGFRYT